MTDKPPCRKCLLNEAMGTIYQTVKDYIESIPPEQKTAPAEYDRRLAICKTCEHLVNGMCTLCGCYVEVRAAKAIQSCVKSAEIW